MMCPLWERAEDITYIHTSRDGWCYLASVLDLHSKKIIGYAFGKRMINDLKELCKEFNIIQSFSKKGCPYDNACIESFHSSMKKEEIYRNTYRTFEEANIAIFKYIEGWYNRKRRLCIMKRERYSIIYSSKTGNTKKLAEAIYNTLPQNKCDYYGTVDKIDDVLSNVIYIGFWTEKGNADHLTIDFLNKLRNKKIFLFGTAGYGESEKYFEGIINNVKKNIDSSNTIIGTFMCQGKMPLSVRKRYEKMREQNNISLNIDKLIANFDKALSHPNKVDLKTLEQIVILYEEK